MWVLKSIITPECQKYLFDCYFWNVDKWTLILCIYKVMLLFSIVQRLISLFIDFVSLLCCCYRITSKMQKVGDAFRVLVNSAIVIDLNGSVLQRQPVSKQSWSMDCQWHCEGSWSQINLKWDFCGTRANTWWPTIKESSCLLYLPFYPACGNAKQCPHVSTSSTVGSEAAVCANTCRSLMCKFNLWYLIPN